MPPRTPVGYRLGSRYWSGHDRRVVAQSIQQAAILRFFVRGKQRLYAVGSLRAFDGRMLRHTRHTHSVRGVQWVGMPTVHNAVHQAQGLRHDHGAQQQRKADPPCRRIRGTVHAKARA